MRNTRSALLCLSFLVSSTLAAQTSGACDLPPLVHEQRDQATLQRLETAWSIAYLHGDTNFERCLLAPDFTEITRSGQVKVLADELAGAAKNTGKNLPIPVLPTSTILIHGNVAVAYAAVRATGPDGKPRGTQNADFYVWERGSWHVYFAQQTAIEDN
jgi:hypothetical protein